MNSIHFIKKQPGSKFFGNPDVWEGFVWPEAKDKDGEEYHLNFLCQIDCAEASKHDKDGMLPKTGMLYFFYDLYDHYARNCAVLYYDGDLSELTPHFLTDDEGLELFTRQAFHVELLLSSDADMEGSFLLGTPSDPEQMGRGEGLDDDEQLLLEVDSYIGSHDLNFGGDCGMLCYIIKKDDLKNKDFSKVWTEMAIY